MKYIIPHYDKTETVFLPVRGDGLKYFRRKKWILRSVSPRKGRWIEIIALHLFPLCFQFLPVRGDGLKYEYERNK